MQLGAVMNRAAAIGLFLATIVAPVEATTLARASLDELILKSTAIVRGRVVGAASTVRGPMI